MKIFLSAAINKYPVAPLRGCVNDSNNMAAYLRSHNFEIIQLLDEQATKANIVAQLKDVISRLDNSDHFIFHYSGHGSQIPCLDGSELDGLTEILCPYDLINSDGSWTNNFITDDEINSILSSAKPVVKIECLLDCCHSGTGTRDIKPNVVYRFIQGPKEVGEYKPFDVVNNLDIICWAGCRDDQTSADAFIDGQFQGAFTSAFLKSSGSRQARYNSIVQYMAANGFAQVPQLTCKDTELELLVI